MGKTIKTESFALRCNRIYSIAERLIQKVYIYCANRIFAFTGKMNNRLRERILQLVCMTIPVYFIMIYSGTVYRWNLNTQLSRHIVGSVILILLLIFSIDREQGYVRWRKIIIIPLFLSGLSILIVSFIHPVGSGYRVFALMLMFLFPAISFVWNNRGDYDRLFDCLAYAITLAGLVYLLVCFWGFTHGRSDFMYSGRLRATMSHSGNLSQFYTSVFCSSLYLLIQHKESKKVGCYAALSVGVSVGMLLLGQGRSCILACIASLICAIFFYFRYIPKDFSLRSIVRIETLLLIIVISSVAVAKMAVLPQYIEEAKERASTEMTEVAGETTINEPAAAVETTDDNQNVTDRFSAEGQDINSFSSGRIALWKLVGSNLNLLGHDVEQQSIRDLTQDDWRIYAHNVFLEISYRCGIPVGLIFILLEFFSGCVCLRYLFANKKKTTWLIFPIMFMIIYVTQSMLDCASMPFILESGCYYYLIMAPMMDRRV